MDVLLKIFANKREMLGLIIALLLDNLYKNRTFNGNEGKFRFVAIVLIERINLE